MYIYKKYKFTCLYCDHKWQETYEVIMKKASVCPICKHKELKKESLDTTGKSDYYGYSDSKPIKDAYIKKEDRESE